MTLSLPPSLSPINETVVQHVNFAQLGIHSFDSFTLLTKVKEAFPLLNEILLVPNDDFGITRPSLSSRPLSLPFPFVIASNYFPSTLLSVSRLRK